MKLSFKRFETAMSKNNAYQNETIPSSARGKRPSNHDRRSSRRRPQSSHSEGRMPRIFLTAAAALSVSIALVSFTSAAVEGATLSEDANSKILPYILEPQQDHLYSNNMKINERRRIEDEQQQEEEVIQCPPSLYGHIPTPNTSCQSFHYCSNGTRTPSLPTMSYTCLDNHLFDIRKQNCRPLSPIPRGSNCYDSTSSISLLQILESNIEMQSMYYTEKEVGPPIYWADVTRGTCIEGNVPEYVHPSKVFGLKLDCCQRMLGWIDLGVCLGDNFVEGNYVLVQQQSQLESQEMQEQTSQLESQELQKEEEDEEEEQVTVSNGMKAASANAESSVTSPTPMLRTRRPTAMPVMPPEEEEEELSHVGSLSLGSGSLHQKDGEEEESQELVDNTIQEEEQQEQQVDGQQEVIETIEEQVLGEEGGEDAGASFISNMILWANTEIENISPGQSLEQMSQTASTSSATASTTLAAQEDRPIPQAADAASESPPQPPQDLPIYEVILPANADGTISSRRRDKNFGTNSAIAVDGGLFSNAATNNNDGGSEGEKFDAFLKFDISSLAKSNTIVIAEIELYVMNGCEYGGDFYVTDSDWNEDTLTWMNAPEGFTFPDGNNGQEPVPLVTLERIEARKWYNVDVTPVVSMWRSDHYMAQDYLSVRISSDVNSRCMYSALEFDETSAPRLMVRYSEGVQQEEEETQEQVMNANANVPVAQGSSAGMNNVNNNAQEHEGELPQQELISEIILSASMDATLSNLRPNNNFGKDSAVVVDGGDYSMGMNSYDFEGERFDALIEFDLSLLDKNRAIDSVMLKLYSMVGCADGGSVYSTTNLYWKEYDVTWNTAPQVVGMAVADIGATVTGEWYLVDLSNMISDGGGFVSALSDYNGGAGGVLDELTLRIQSSSKSRCMYSSVQYGEVTSPKLIVKYGAFIGTTTTPPPPTTTESIVPQAASLSGAQEVSIMEVSASGETSPCRAMIQPTQDLIPVSGNFILLVATDDATIDVSTFDDKLGNSQTLSLVQDVTTREIQDIIIRFDLSTMHGVQPRSALLTLFPESECESAGLFSTTGGDDNWSQDDVTWATAPTYDGNMGGSLIGTFGRVESGRWYGFSVVDALALAVRDGKETITFRLRAGNNMDSCSYASIERGLPPKLLVAF